MSVIQFNSATFQARDELVARGYLHVTIPQEKPRCGGETLGCTSAVLDREGGRDTVVFIADGRFHMEGAMIANPGHTFFQYNPYECAHQAKVLPRRVRLRRNDPGAQGTARSRPGRPEGHPGGRHPGGARATGLAAHPGGRLSSGSRSGCGRRGCRTACC